MPGPWPGPREGLSAMLKMIDELTYGNTQKPFSIGGDEYPAGTMSIGSVPGGPSDIKGLIGMAGRLKGLLGRGARAARGYHGSAPLAGSQGIPHTSPLPNQGPPVMGGAPPSGGGYADDAAGLMRGDIPLEKPRLGADFQAMDDLGAMQEPLTTTGRNFGMDIPQTQMPPSAGLTPYGLDNVLSEFNALNSQGQMPYEDIVEYLVGKHGDWILDFI